LSAADVSADRLSRGRDLCQFDLWEPRAEIPVGHGQTRRGWVVIACLGYSRAGAGALIFSKQTPDLLVAELALDDDQRHALAGHLDGVRVAQLVRRKASPYAGLAGDAS
jgi:hypothetical protein